MQPGTTDADDLPRQLAYRRAYGLAADLVELAERGLAGYGAADLPEPEARRLAERITDDVTREMGTDSDRAAIAEAVGDALAGRGPRW